MLVYSPLETQLTHLPSSNAIREGGHAVCVCVRITKEAGVFFTARSRAGYLATINGAAVEHQFASTNG